MLDYDLFRAQGIAVIGGICSLEELIGLAECVGKIVPHPNGEDVAILRSSDGTNSLAGTFSKVYGLSEFPFHTDTAFWRTPVRYVVMGMMKNSRCATNFISLSDISKILRRDLIAEAKKSIYLIETCEGCKYISPVFFKDDEWGIRFDPNIMTPANKSAKIFHSELLHAINKTEALGVDWNGDKAVVFDNWRYLHNRSAVNNEKREIFRIYTES